MRKKENFYRTLEDVYLDNRKLVFAYIAEYSKEEAVMEEIASTVWVQAWEYGETILRLERKAVKRYLWAIVKSKIGDYRRELEKEKNLIIKISENMEDIKPWETDMKQAFLEGMYAYLQDALCILSEEERLILLLRFKENHTAKEVGQILNISENNVRVRQFRIIAKMRKHIEKSIERGVEENERKYK